MYVAGELVVQFGDSSFPVCVAHIVLDTQHTSMGLWLPLKQVALSNALPVSQFGASTCMQQLRCQLRILYAAASETLTAL